jgi:hypothetical protein
MLLINVQITEGKAFKPITDTEFYLLKEDIETIFKKTEDDPQRAMSLKVLSMVCAATEEEAGFNVDEYVRTAIEPYLVEKAKTDVNGNAEFSVSKPDIYYLFGMKKFRYGCAVWSKKIDIKNNQQVINLNRENAEMGLF